MPKEALAAAAAEAAAVGVLAAAEEVAAVVSVAAAANRIRDQAAHRLHLVVLLRLLHRVRIRHRDLVLEALD